MSRSLGLGAGRSVTDREMTEVSATRGVGRTAPNVLETVDSLALRGRVVWRVDYVSIRL